MGNPIPGQVDARGYSAVPVTDRAPPWEFFRLRVLNQNDRNAEPVRLILAV
jgi:hypothetical protein